MYTINEGSTSYHNIAIHGYDGSIITPDLLRYKITDGFKVTITDWTVIDNDTDQISISPTINTISTTHGKLRYLTVEATHNTTDKITSEVCYEITNLIGIATI
jgi:hypothetical protein